jgi:hypothetical protein
MYGYLDNLSARIEQNRNDTYVGVYSNHIKLRRCCRYSLGGQRHGCLNGFFELYYDALGSMAYLLYSFCDRFGDSPCYGLGCGRFWHRDVA